MASYPSSGQTDEAPLILRYSIIRDGILIKDDPARRGEAT